MANVSHRAPSAGLAPTDTVMDRIDELEAYVIANAVAGPQGPQGPAGTGSDGSTYNVGDYGAVADGVTDDRAAIQAAIDACSAAGGGVVALMQGTHIVGRNSTNFYCLLTKSNVRIRGGGRDVSTLKQAPGIAASVRLIYTGGAVDAAVSDLTLDGNKATQSVSEHRHGIYANGSERLLVERVTAKNFTGDGFFLYTAANNTTFRDCFGTLNDRNGITFGATLDGCNLESCYFTENEAQQVDSEPGGVEIVSNVRLSHCVLDGGAASTSYVLTCSGTGTASRGYGWTVENCELRGPTYVVWCDDVKFIGNTIDNPTEHRSIEVNRGCERILIEGNRFHMTDAGLASGIINLYVVATGTSNQPNDVDILNNTIISESADAIGIMVKGALRCNIKNNTVIAAGGGATYGGILVRASFDAKSIVIIGNTVRNCGVVGVRVYDGGDGGKIESLDVSHNTFDDDQGSPTMVTGVSLDENSENTAEKIACIGNQYSGGVTTPVVWPGVTPVLIGGTRGAGGIYSVTGTPEGALAEAVGAMAFDRAGGAGTSVYVKESGTGNTGWVAK